MKIELIKSNTLVNGIKDISDRFGPSALILRNIEDEGQEILFIAHEESKTNAPTEAEPRSTGLKTSELSDSRGRASKDEIELVKQAIKSLPNSFNLPERTLTDSPFEESKPAHKGSTALNDFKKETLLENKFNQLLEETPVSKHIKKILSGFLNKPTNMSELISQIESGIITSLPATVEFNLESQIHVLAGGHGSGKTSAALKIAKQLQEAYNTNISIISFGKQTDTNESELKMLSGPLNLEAFCVSNVNELAKLLYLNQSNNIYIVDLELDSMSSAIPFIRGVYKKAQFHLVTPTDASLPSLWENCILDKWDSIILTRLDSPLVPWAALEALSKFKIPLSIGSNSNDATSSLVKVTKRNISHRITGYINDHISKLKSSSTRETLMKASALH